MSRLTTCLQKDVITEIKNRSKAVHSCELVLIRSTCKFKNVCSNNNKKKKQKNNGTETIQLLFAFTYHILK